MSKLYLAQNVLEAAEERLRLVFDEFETVVVSYSGGKDSTVLLSLARAEAKRRDRQVYALFIDLEAQYAETIRQVERTMLGDPVIVPIWVCLPINLRNAVSLFQPHWVAWDPAERDRWVRPLPAYDCVLSDPEALPWFHRMDFEEFIVEFPKWFVTSHGLRNYGSLVAIRADESLNRYKAVALKLTGEKKSAWHDSAGRLVRWGTVLDAKHPHIVSLYPIYDWHVEDVWKYTAEASLTYNRIYDMMYLAGVPFSEQRICQPYGDDQRRGLDLWAKAEPETWSRVLDRVMGVNYGARYAGQKMLGYHRGLELPEGHSWKSYTFLLLSTLPDAVRERYLSNYAVFLEWWMRHGYPDLAQVHDDETAERKRRGAHRLPSWRRLALAVLKNDFNCKSLTIGGVKDVYRDVYDRVAAGEPVIVRKSVRPVYEYLREQYQAYLAGGVDQVTFEFQPVPNPTKAKYRDL